MNFQKIHIVLFAAFLCLGGILGWYVHRSGPPAVVVANQVRADVSSLKFTNPLLYSNNPKNTSSLFDPLLADLNQYIASSTANNDLTSVGIYFRDINSGNWTGINEDGSYSPASMLKVIVLTAVLKIAETDPAFMVKEIHYVPDTSTSFYMPHMAVREGYYSVGELASNMIIYSDNASMYALMSNADVKAVYTDLYEIFRLPPPAATTTEDFMSARAFSSVFRALYNSTLLSWNLSEQALDALSKTVFKDGIVAGVPSNVRVSHKFGETGYELPQKTIVHELHDCGIVYATNPFLLCIMAKGPDFYKLEKVIADISRLTYQFDVRVFPTAVSS